MDRQTVFTKTAKGLMEATGKTSLLSRDMRTLLKEVDGKANFGELLSKLGKVPEAKLQEALQVLLKSDFIREFAKAQGAAPAPAPADADVDLDFTVAIPTLPSLAKQAEEEARKKAQAAAEAAARAKAEAVVKARIEAEIKAKAAAEAAARAEAKARAEREAQERARAEAERQAREAAERKRREAEEQARREAEEKAKREAEERAKREAEERARREAEEQARREAEEKAKREAEEQARREAEEAERRAREEAERRAREEAERQRREAEEQAKREAEERARREAEEKAKREAEEQARREAEEAERRAREEAERQAREEAERQRREAEEQARREAEEQARREAEEKAKREAEEAERQAREEAERQAREQAERQRHEAEELAKREAEERARREAEEQVKRETEDRARREAEELARREAEAQAARESAQQPAPQEEPASALEDMVRIETDFDAVLSESAAGMQEAPKRVPDADDRLQREAEEQARRQAEEQSAREAEERASRQAQAEPAPFEEKAQPKDEAPEEVADLAAPHERERAELEAQALLDAQNAETERHFADMEKELEAERAAAPPGEHEAEAPARPPSRKERKEAERASAALREAELDSETEPAPVDYRERTKWGKPVALVLFLILALGLVLVHFISFEAYIPQFEKAAGDYMQQPVKIKALHLSLVPQPHWRLDGVTVGKEGELTVARIDAVAELGSMFSEHKAFSRIELDSPVLSVPGLLGLLFGKPQGQEFKVASVIAKNAKLDSKTFVLPALDAKISFGAGGAWQQIALETPDHKTSLTLKPEGEGAQIEVETNAFSLPFHPEFILENFVAKGVIRRGELRLDELKGGIYRGYMSGKASLKWGAGWSLNGEIGARAMDPARFAPALVEDGKLEGNAVFAMRAASYDDLFDAPRLEGTFTIEKGALLGVDLGRLLQGGDVGGKTMFAELGGSFLRESGRTQLRQLHLVAGPVSAGGTADSDAGKHLSGRFTVELKSPVAHARANLGLSGSLGDPRFSR